MSEVDGSNLYKFIGRPADVEFLLRGFLKFTPIPELNDPSELLPNVIREEVKTSLERLKRTGYTEEDMVHLRQQGEVLRLLAPGYYVGVPGTRRQASDLISRAGDEHLPFIEVFLDGVAREVSSNVGLFCLTKRRDSLPMWAHYAANASGLVVEFRDLHEVFCGDSTGILRKPIPVRYEREQFSVTYEPRSHESLFLAKFQDWGYEQEVRIVLPLADCRQSMHGGRLLYSFDVSPKHIARVILGWRMDVSTVDAVVELVRSINPETEVIKAYIGRGTVRDGETIYSCTE